MGGIDAGASGLGDSSYMARNSDMPTFSSRFIMNNRLFKSILKAFNDNNLM